MSRDISRRQFAARTAATLGVLAATGAVAPSARVETIAGVGVNVLDFGATGDGETDDSAAISRAWDAAHDTTGVLVFPSGVFVIEPNVLDKQVRRSMTVTGMGPGVSTLQAKAGSVDGRWRRLMWFDVHSDVESILLRDITLDGNARNQPEPPEPYSWEQAHLALVSVADSGRLGLFHASNVRLKDPTADGISIGTEAVETLLVQNCTGTDRRRTRSDITLPYLPKTTVIQGFVGHSIEVENERRGATDERVVIITGCKVDILDCLMEKGEQTPGVRNMLQVTNTRVEEATFIAYTDLLMVGCDVRMPFQNPGNLRGTRPGSVIADTLFRLPYYPDTREIDSVYVAEDGSDTEVTFQGCRFVIDHNGPISPLKPGAGTAITGNRLPKDASQTSRKVVQDCWFDPRLQRSIQAVNTGQWILRDNVYGGTEAAISYEASDDFRVDVTVDGGDWTAVDGFGIDAVCTGDPSHRSLRLTGRHLGAAAARITVTGDPSEVVSTRTVEMAAAELPEGKPESGFAGDGFIVGRPGRAAEHWSCTATNQEFAVTSLD